MNTDKCANPDKHAAGSFSSSYSEVSLKACLASLPLACDGCESSHRIARATSLDQPQSWEPSFVRVQGCA